MALDGTQSAPRTFPIRADLFAQCAKPLLAPSLSTLDLLRNFTQARGREENVALAHQKNEAAGDPQPASGDGAPRGDDP